MESFLGSVFAFGFNFPPVGWLPCDGRLLPIAENEALYTLLGTTYGGNGTTTFALPNLMGRVPIGTGQGPGLSNYVLGQAAGTENVTLISNNLANHTHAASAKVPVGNGDSGDPTNRFFGTSDSTVGSTYLATAGATMAPNTGNTTPAGGNTPFGVINPYQAVNYCIAIAGIYPTQS